MTLQIIHDWRATRPEERGASIAFGAFDGVHLGHQTVIAAAGDAARALGAPWGVALFDPHPKRWLNPDAELFLIATPAQRNRVLERLGVERLYRLGFDDEVSSMGAQRFCEEVLVGAWGIRHICVGFDMRFGSERHGGTETLTDLGRRLGFGVTIVPRADDEAGEKLSSTALRIAIAAGDVARAARILGRPFAIEGEVVRGRQLGRTLGFPTANVRLGEYVRPRFGVYATRTRLPDGRVVDGVSSIGVTPTVGEREAQLEVWLFGFDEDIYGQVIETDLIAFIRPEAAFAGLEEMKAEVKRDAQAARAILAR